MKLFNRHVSASPGRGHETSRDQGTSLVEVIVSITILGGLGVAVMSGLLASVVGSRVERDHARAHEWLQSATEVLVNDVSWIDCTTTNPTDLADDYEDELQGYVDIVPPGWGAYDIEVPVDVEYPDPSGAYGFPCDPDENRQKIVLQVKSPDNRIIETVEVVKVP